MVLVKDGYERIRPVIGMRPILMPINFFYHSEHHYILRGQILRLDSICMSFNI